MCISGLQCFDAIGWAAGRASAYGGVLAWLCLERGAELRKAQLMPLPLTVSCFSKIRVVPDEGPLKGGGGCVY